MEDQGVSTTSICRCCQIMGPSEKDELSAAQILYPCMQCADIFFLKPVRDHFKNNLEAKKLLKTVKSYKVTRSGLVKPRPRIFLH